MPIGITKTKDRAAREAKGQAKKVVREKLDRVARRRVEREAAWDTEWAREVEEWAAEAARVKAERVAKHEARKRAREKTERKAIEKAAREEGRFLGGEQRLWSEKRGIGGRGGREGARRMVAERERVGEENSGIWSCWEERFLEERIWRCAEECVGLWEVQPDDDFTYSYFQFV